MIRRTRLICRWASLSLVLSGLVFLSACGGGAPPPPTLTITTSVLGDSVVGVAYSKTMTAAGGLPPVTWGLAAGSGPLPTPLVINSTTGVISGTPDTPGTFNVSVQAQDSAASPQRVTKAFTITIAPPPAGRNDTIANATPLTNGRFAASLSPYADPDTVRNPDEDFYKITATTGATVTVEIFSKRLLPASLLDSMIQIVDVNGTTLTTCRNQGNDDGVTGASDPTPLAFDDVCFNDDITLGVVQDSYLELQVPAGATTFYVRVLSWGGGARPDFLYEIAITGAN